MSGRVLILLHATDPYPEGPSYFAWGLRDVWREMGIDVRIARGLDETVDADLVLPHIDLTITPRPYRTLLDALPNVANAGLYDISKRRVSRHLVTATDPWRGPVIVKTDRNHGGLPERSVARAERNWRTRMVSNLGRAVRGHAAQSLVRGTDYLIFDGLARVPEQAFSDRSLVIEKFLPEREGDRYYLRWYIFIGDRYRSMRIGSNDPLVKLGNREGAEFGVDVPASVVALREEWGMDYGKIDYVMHNGVPVILDVSRTPSDVPPAQRLETCRPYGPGILSLLARASGKERTLTHRDVDRV